MPLLEFIKTGPICVIYHGKCIDGRTSLHILENYVNKHSLQIAKSTEFFYSKPDIEPWIQSCRDQYKTPVFIYLDISHFHEFHDTDKVAIIDHHYSSVLKLADDKSAESDRSIILTNSSIRHTIFQSETDDLFVHIDCSRSTSSILSLITGYDENPDLVQIIDCVDMWDGKYQYLYHLYSGLNNRNFNDYKQIKNSYNDPIFKSIIESCEDRVKTLIEVYKIQAQIFHKSRLKNEHLGLPTDKIITVISVPNSPDLNILFSEVMKVSNVSIVYCKIEIKNDLYLIIARSRNINLPVLIQKMGFAGGGHVNAATFTCHKSKFKNFFHEL